MVLKKTKKGERELDIRPLIYEARVQGNGIFLKLAAGSSENLKPELVMDAFASYTKTELPEFALLIHRQELYADVGTDKKQCLVPLESLGEVIETARQ